MSKIKNKYHYFYKITNNINGHFYYGVHNTNNLDDGYMGSGVRLHYAYKKYGVENFTKEILKFFNTQKEAFEYESEIVTEELVNRDDCYNLQVGGKYLNTHGYTTVKDKNGNTFLVSVNDPRFLSGELVGVSKGMVSVYNINDPTKTFFQVPIDDPRYISGELVRPSKGKVTVYNKDDKDEMFQVPIDDPRYISGELISMNKHKILAKDINNKVYYVDIDDERYVNGELKPFWIGRKHSDITKEKISNSYKINNHQKGEKNSQYGTCWIHNDKKSIKIKKEQLDEYISNGWIKGRKMKF